MKQEFSMNKLIISLANENELCQTIAFATSLKQENFNSKISVLTYLELAECLRNVHPIGHVFTINRQSIRKLQQSKLFSDGFAINSLVDDLSPLQSIKWDEIINYSNNEISTRLCSFFNSTHYFGKKYSSQNLVKYSNQWAILQNEVFNNLTTNPIHPLDLESIICDIPPITHELKGNNKRIAELSLEFSGLSENIVKKNIEQLRLQNNNHNIKLIGVNFGKNKFWDSDDQCLDLISCIAAHGYYYPILIYLSGQEQEDKIAALNSKFNNQLTTVQCDHISARSMIKNLDLLIGPESAFSYYADLLAIPHITIFTNSQDLYKGHSLGQNNLCLLIDDTDLEFPQIQHALDYFSQTGSDNQKYSYNGQSYLIEQDALGAKLVLFNLSSVNKEIVAYEFYRIYLLAINDLLTEDTLKKSISYYGKSLLEWQKFEEEKMIDISKDLLRNLRMIQQLKKENDLNNNEQLIPLIRAIDKLLSNIDSLSFTSIPLLVFQTNLHNAPKTNLKTMIKIIERICYDLKNSLKIQLQLLSSIDQLASKHSSKISRTFYEMVKQ